LDADINYVQFQQNSRLQGCIFVAIFFSMHAFFRQWITSYESLSRKASSKEPTLNGTVKQRLQASGEMAVWAVPLPGTLKGNHGQDQRQQCQ